MTPKSTLLAAFATSDNAAVRAQVDTITQQVASSFWGGGIDSMTGVTVPVPKPKGGGGFPEIVRGFEVMRLLISRIQLEVATSSPGLANPASFVLGRLNNIVDDLCQPASGALEPTDVRGLFGPQGPDVADLVGIASGLSAFSVGLPGNSALFEILQTKRSNVLDAVMSRLDTPGSP